MIISDTAKIKTSIQFEDQLKGDIMERKYDGRAYLFTVNSDPRQKAGRAIIKVGGLKTGTKIGVVDEDRVPNATGGAFADEFDPLGDHIYMIGR